MADEASVEIVTDRVDLLGCAHCGATLGVEQYEPFSLIECPHCHEQMHVPARLGTFILLQEFGKGGMGAVYKGFDEVLKRSVAFKVMQRSLGADRGFVEQFLREARALAALNHPNVVQIYNYGEEKGQPYIVMELVDGGRLDNMMKDHGPLDETFVLATAIQVIKGLRAAAGIGMTHGDIKPANILYDREKNAKVVDFGLARFQGEKPRPGEVWGTPFYVAPEVVRGKQPDQKADIYSLGGTLYHALLGQPPFNGETVQDTVLARFKHPAPNLRNLRADIHPETAAVIARMLELDVFTRYPNYDSLLPDVQAALDAVRRGPAPPVENKKSHAGLIVGGTLALVLAGVGLLLFLLFKPTPPPPGPPEPAPTGPVKMRLVGGKLVPYTDAPAPAKPGPPPAPKRAPGQPWQITTRTGNGADGYVQGNTDLPNGGSDSMLWVKAGRNAKPELSRKAFLRFDLSDVDKTILTDVALNLTAIKAGSNKSGDPYKLQLWGLKEDSGQETWQEGGLDALTWANAPANSTRDPTKPDQQAVLLATVTPPPNPNTGDLITFSNADSTTPNALLYFIRGDRNNHVTFILTADDQAEQKAGWKFSTKENDRFLPPTLVLSAP